MIQHRLLIPCVAAALCMLAACSAGQSPSTSTNASLGNEIDHALDQADQKLSTENITVSHDNGLPRAEITPSGDFIVDSKTVALTPAQRSALLEYRSQMIAVASEGIALGKQGAALGMHAAGTAIAAALSGASDQEVEKKMQAETAGIRQAAAKLCDRLPAMMTEQQKLAAILPAFKPYATMTEKDISDCRTDALKDDDN